MKKTILHFVILFLLSCVSLNAQTSILPAELKEGLDSFENAKYQQALIQFRDIILETSLEKYHADAYYWIGRTHLALGNIEKAAQNIDFFIVQYPEHGLIAEALYQKGRVLYLQQEYEKAIRQLYSFIERFPGNSYVSNGFFWIGESFYALGHLDKAEDVYRHIVDTFPRSFKYEAANYRISLIDLKRREQELLKLLKISHEEYLKALEEFEQREKTYEQAISSYQRKLSATTGEQIQINEGARQVESRITDKEAQIAQLKNQLQNEKNRVESLQRELDSLAVTRQAPKTSSLQGDKDSVRKLLELKNSALSLKMYYIDWLMNNQE